MAAEQRKALQALMGQEAMTGSAPAMEQMQLTDPKVCRSYLAGTCPHDLFNNTKGDLGPCPKAHNSNLKAEWDALPADRKDALGFEYDFFSDIRRHVTDCDRRVNTAQRRLEKTPEEIAKTNALLKEIGDLTTTLELTSLELDQYMSQAMSSQASREVWKARQVMLRKTDRERELKNVNEQGGPSGHQKLQVCDVCGAYLSRLDNDRRLSDHFWGKMHLGFAAMRKDYKELEPKYRNYRPPFNREGMNGGYGDDGGGYRRGGGGGGGGGGYRGGRGGGYRGGHRRGRY